MSPAVCRAVLLVAAGCLLLAGVVSGLVPRSAGEVDEDLPECGSVVRPSDQAGTAICRRTLDRPFDVMALLLLAGTVAATGGLAMRGDPGPRPARDPGPDPEP